MLEFLKNYLGNIKINGERVESSSFISTLDKCSGDIDIVLTPKNFIDNNQALLGHKQTFSFYVKQWMLEHSTDDFTFMSLWNKDLPMPMRYMSGTVEKETSRMYYVKLCGVPRKTVVCQKCGKTLTNPISRLFGIGPECSQKLGINPKIFMTDELAKEQLCQIENQIKNTQWEGWLPKTAILEMTEN